MTAPQTKDPDLKCRACAQANRVARFNHHWFLDRQNGVLADHLLDVYGADYEISGRLKRRLDLIQEADRIYHSVETIQNGWGMVDAYYQALKRLGVPKTRIKSGVELGQPRGD